MNQRNENGQRHGYWEIYFANGNLWSMGYYNNGEEDGYWVEYYPDGKLDYKAFYL